MILYRTAKGEWHPTQAAVTKANRLEGSKAGAWRKVTVPDNKASRVDFLNAMRREAAQIAAEAEQRAKPAATPPKGKNAARWRVYGGLRDTVFVASTFAKDAAEAAAAVAASLTARPDLSR